MKGKEAARHGLSDEPYQRPVTLGSVYAIIALGYTMVYGIAKMLNFAHGDIIMVGGYVCFCAVNYLGLPTGVGVLLSIVACTVLGIVIERLAYKPLRNAPSLDVLITAIGVSYFLQNAALLIWGSDTKSFPSVVNLPSVSLFDGQLVVSAITICHGHRGRRRHGWPHDVHGQDPHGQGHARLLRGPRRRHAHGHQRELDHLASRSPSAPAWPPSPACCMCSAYPTLIPTTGSLPGIKAFTAAVIGGIGSIPGAFVGGLVLGVIEIFAKAYVGTQLADAIVFGVLIVVLLVKPSGLLGKTVREKV